MATTRSRAKSVLGAGHFSSVSLDWGTRPEMMAALGKVGFQQGYSYFTWRTTKWELEAYLDEVSHQTSHFYRPNFFVNTPDINPIYLNDGNPAFRVMLETEGDDIYVAYDEMDLYAWQDISVAKLERFRILSGN